MIKHDQPAGPLKVLHVEDTETDEVLISRQLRKHGFRVESRCVWTQESFLEALQSFVPDVILSDFTMPTFNGLRALELARARAPGAVFIFVSGSIRPQDAADALSHGASAYLGKHQLDLLGPAIERAIKDRRTPPQE
jgi:CheY-like chemotaxis protein